MSQYTRGVGPLTTKGTIKHTTENGTETWRLNGELHRVNGPARIWSDGVADWYRDGVLHRIDGPARDWDGDNWWYVRGNPIFTYEELQEVTELSEADVLLLKLKWGPMGPWPDHAENGEE